MFKYNLQYFAEENNNDTNDSNSGNDSVIDTNDTDTEKVDVQAFADIISEKDKELKELQAEISKLKKSNADLLIKVTAGDKPPVEIEETILDFCDTRKVR